jgi:NAD(P)-dependent dehydrogenase (short-subunit alcohol dehydrogenase family)
MTGIRAPGDTVAVITGASGGIGAALARQLGAAGYRLALAARRQEVLEQVAADAAPMGRAVALATDVTRRRDVERLRDHALAQFGRIDVWVNNAGRGIKRAVLELSDEDFDEMMAVNVKSALYGIQAIVPYFIGRDAGHLVNVSSYLGRVPLATFRSAYSAAKAALNTLTANLRVDLRTRAPHVRVSLVLPGLVTTDFARNALGALADVPALPPPPTAGVPQTPTEVADIIARLLKEPVPEVYTNPAHPALTQRYYRDVAAFEAGPAPPPPRDGTAP